MFNNKRFEFIYQTCNTVKGHSIRKENFKRILNGQSEFKNILNIKFCRDYGHTVYLPLTKWKNIDILDQNYRADFN